MFATFCKRFTNMLVPRKDKASQAHILSPYRAKTTQKMLAIFNQRAFLRQVIQGIIGSFN